MQITFTALFFPDETAGFSHTEEQIIPHDPFGRFSEVIVVEAQAPC